MGVTSRPEWLHSDCCVRAKNQSLWGHEIPLSDALTPQSYAFFSSVHSPVRHSHQVSERPHPQFNVLLVGNLEGSLYAKKGDCYLHAHVACIEHIKLQIRYPYIDPLPHHSWMQKYFRAVSKARQNQHQSQRLDPFRPQSTLKRYGSNYRDSDFSKKEWVQVISLTISVFTICRKCNAQFYSKEKV